MWNNFPSLSDGLPSAYVDAIKTKKQSGIYQSTTKTLYVVWLCTRARNIIILMHPPARFDFCVHWALRDKHKKINTFLHMLISTDSLGLPVFRHHMMHIYILRMHLNAHNACIMHVQLNALFAETNKQTNLCKLSLKPANAVSACSRECSRASLADTLMNQLKTHCIKCVKQTRLPATAGDAHHAHRAPAFIVCIYICAAAHHKHVIIRFLLLFV